MVPLTHSTSPGRAVVRSTMPPAGTSPKAVSEMAMPGPRTVSPPRSAQPEVAAGGRGAGGAGGGAEPFAERREPGLAPVRRQGQRQHETDRRRALGSEVGEGDAERLCA